MLCTTARFRLWTVIAVLAWGPVSGFADTVLITGANSGIGFEFARQYAADGWPVIATHRRASKPGSLRELSEQFENVQVEKIDVTDMQSITATALKLDGMPIDILINNAGIVGGLRDPQQQFGALDYELFHQFMDVNVAGPLRVSEAFYNNIVASRQKKIVAISSMSGSIQARYGNNGPPIRYWYDSSKAALNMSFVSLAKDASGDGVSVAVYHPGLVRVARTEKYGIPDEMQHLFTEVEDSVSELRKLFAELTPADSGRFYSHRGNEMPW